MMRSWNYVIYVLVELLGASKVLTVGFVFEMSFSKDPKKLNTHPGSLNRHQCLIHCFIQLLIWFQRQ